MGWVVALDPVASVQVGQVGQAFTQHLIKLMQAFGYLKIAPAVSLG